jgi:hypothetical protein
MRCFHPFLVLIPCILGVDLLGQPIRLAVEDGYVIASTCDAPKVGYYRSDRQYHWVRAQRIYRTQGGGSGELMHGTYLAYHVNGQLKEAGHFNQGLKHGEWRSWNDLGDLISMKYWRHGKERVERDARANRIKNGRASHEEGSAPRKVTKEKREEGETRKSRKARAEREGPAKGTTEDGTPRVRSTRKQR